jgi:Fe2+ or Zn2+ uptake regulation protein
MTCRALDPAELRSALEAAGWRYTRQREAVYRILSQVEGRHPSAEEIYQGVKDSIPNISLATVYKALEALEAAGVVTKLPALGAGDGSARYDARADHHYHLRCLHSGRVEDLPTPYDPDLLARLDPELDRRLRDQGFHLTGYRLELVGYFGEGASHGGETHDEAS